jgi:hypothetical protein
MVIEPGTYRAGLKSITAEWHRDHGQSLRLIFEILDAPYKGRTCSFFRPGVPRPGWSIGLCIRGFISGHLRFPEYLDESIFLCCKYDICIKHDRETSLSKVWYIRMIREAD